jgi:predicted O-methyltransferase YrrM
MTLEIIYGNVTQGQADWMERACGPAPDGVPHKPGTAEPWISQLVASFVTATGARTVLECGAYRGGTSVYLWSALWKTGGGDLHLCEIDPERMAIAKGRVLSMHDGGELGVHTYFHEGDVLQYLAETETRFDCAWVDDNHEKPHVAKELSLLIPKMNPGGLILGHDVIGTCDLQEVFKHFGGYSLDLPRLGSAGGVGILQC